jgi:hypothetical protein
MRSLAEQLDPPFYAAILNDNTEQRMEDADHVAPSDKMVSLAPGQPGFLGLETTEDRTGKWVAVSYWRDMDALNAWEQRGDIEIRKRFDGVGLKETCGLRVSKISEKLGSAKHLRAEKRNLTSSTLATLGAGVLGLFPSLAGLFGYEQHLS